MGVQAGAAQSGNLSLVGALLGMKMVPLSMGAMERTLRENLKPAIADINIKALRFGLDAASQT
jgi:indolepyruvate ferredoxin oxidoreductase beta subunit